MARVINYPLEKPYSQNGRRGSSKCEKCRQAAIKKAKITPKCPFTGLENCVVCPRVLKNVMTFMKKAPTVKKTLDRLSLLKTHFITQYANHYYYFLIYEYGRMLRSWMTIQDTSSENVALLSAIFTVVSRSFQDKLPVEWKQDLINAHEQLKVVTKKRCTAKVVKLAEIVARAINNQSSQQDGSDELPHDFSESERE